MSAVHRCSLPQKHSGLPKLAPNASYLTRMVRVLRTLIILNPKNFRCKGVFHTSSAVLQEQSRHIKGKYRYIIHPFSTLSIFLEIICFMVWLTRMLYVPINMSVIEKYNLMETFEYCCTHFVQPVLIVSFFFVGYVDKDNTVVLEHKKIVCRYARTYFIFDLSTTVILNATLEAFVLNLLKEGDAKWRFSQILDYTDSWCLYARLSSVLEVLDDVGHLVGLRKKFRMCVKYFLKTFLCLHLLACMMYFIPQIVYCKHWPGDSWIILARIEPEGEASYGTIYAECLLITTCYFFGASPGWYQISQTNEQVYLAFISLFGRLYTLFLLADILKLFGIVGIAESNYEKQRMKIREYMVHNQLNNSIRSRMVSYYEHKLQKRYFNEEMILSSLSDRLRAEIFLFSSKKMVRKASMFQHLPKADLALLVSMMRLETFAPGDVIFTAGQVIETAYFISSGTIAVLTKDGQELIHLEDGDVFGLCKSSLDETFHTSMAVDSTDVFTISFKDLQEFLEQYPLALEHMHQLAKRRTAFYNWLEENVQSKNDTCIMELKKGVLLEKRKMRTVDAL